MSKIASASSVGDHVMVGGRRAVIVDNADGRALVQFLTGEAEWRRPHELTSAAPFHAAPRRCVGCGQNMRVEVPAPHEPGYYWCTCPFAIPESLDDGDC